MTDTATTEIYTLSLHDALPIYALGELQVAFDTAALGDQAPDWRLRLLSKHRDLLLNDLLLFQSLMLCTARSEEHTSELQSQSNLVCRLLLEKKKRSVNNFPVGL